MTQTAPAETAPPRWREVFMGARAGLAGASVALADAGTISIELGLAGAFAIGIVAAVLLALVARRLPYARAALSRNQAREPSCSASSDAVREESASQDAVGGTRTGQFR